MKKILLVFMILIVNFGCVSQKHYTKKLKRKFEKSKVIYFTLRPVFESVKYIPDTLIIPELSLDSNFYFNDSFEIKNKDYELKLNKINDSFLFSFKLYSDTSIIKKEIINNDTNTNSLQLAFFLVIIFTIVVIIFLTIKE